MAHDPILYVVHKNKDGTFKLDFDKLSKAEAAQYLMVLAAQQDKRAEPVVDDGAVFKAARQERAQLDTRAALLVLQTADHQRAQCCTVEHQGMTTEQVAAALGVDPFPEAAVLTGGPRFVTKLALFDHVYEPGAFGVCKRCGGEKH